MPYPELEEDELSESHDYNGLIRMFENLTDGKMPKDKKRHVHLRFVAENVPNGLGDMIREAMEYGRISAIKGASLPELHLGVDHYKLYS